VLVSEQNKRLVREITDVIWNGRDLDRIAEFYAPDFVGDYRPYALREGHAGVRTMVEGAWKAFPDYHEEIHDLIAESDRVVAHLTGRSSGSAGSLTICRR
jgi:predicted ester cyclase